MFIKRKYTLDYPEKWGFEIKGAADEFLKEFGLKPNYICVSSPHLVFTPSYRENLLKVNTAKMLNPETNELIAIPKGTALNMDNYKDERNDIQLKFCADESLDLYEFVLIYTEIDLWNPDPREKKGSVKKFQKPVMVVR